MPQEIYYKATLKNGVSSFDPLFVYHLGLNIHPKPDNQSSKPCGEGIHLAKTPDIAKRLVPKWKELYEAKAGVILGEDIEKIRVASCLLIRRIETPDILFPKRPSLSEEWLNEHAFDITMEDINKQTLEIVIDGKHTTTINARLRNEDMRHIIKARVC